MTHAEATNQQPKSFRENNNMCRKWHQLICVEVRLMPQMAPPLYPQCLVTTCAADGTTDNTEGNFLISTVVHLYHIMQRPSYYCLFCSFDVENIALSSNNNFSASLRCSGLNPSRSIFRSAKSPLSSTSTPFT